MLPSLSKDHVSVQLCFGCFAIEQIDPIPVLFGALTLYLQHKEGRSGKEAALACLADNSAGDDREIENLK
ncbi:hypothetical protein TIFTF001_010193 [Ficus carica]|uniref:Uncharacterized protein n=1 Tax=Ficus carica TaxID=3494 RepID=A0AA88D1W2_FICCA|nr:hypothetical protein TIFTF001_010193 [Ficus carica]